MFKIGFLLFIYCLLIIDVTAQNFNRVSPQVTKNTILINRDTDIAELKKQLMYAYRNVDHPDIENIRVAHLIIESFISIGDIKINKDSWSLKKGIQLIYNNNTIKVTKDQSLLEIIRKHKNILASQIKNNIENDFSYNQITRSKAKEIIESLESSVDEQSFIKSYPIINKLFDNLPGLVEIYFESSKLSKSEDINFQDLKPLFLSSLNAIGKIIDIPEFQRIKAITEIIFVLEDRLRNIKVNVKENNLQIDLGRQQLLFKKEDIYLNLYLKIFQALYEDLEAELIDRVGLQHPSVKYYKEFYSKISTTINEQYIHGKVENEYIAMILNSPLAPFIEDLKVLNNISNLNKIDSLTFKTDVAIVIQNKYRRLNESSDLNLNEELKKIKPNFVKDHLISFIIDLLESNVQPAILKAVETPSRFAWINNFSISEYSELSTTLNYKISNQYKFGWEISADFFFNDTAELDTISDDNEISDKDFSRRMIIGTGLKFVPGVKNNFEIGSYAGISADVASELADVIQGVAKSPPPDFYLGVYGAWKINSPYINIFRPFIEYERQVKNLRLNDPPKEKFLNGGLEIKFPKGFLIDGFYANFKWHFKDPDQERLNDLEFGITFPIID